MGLVYPARTTTATAGNADSVGGVTPTANALTLLGATFAQMRAALDLEGGVDFQAYSALLAAIAALSPAEGATIMGNGTTWGSVLPTEECGTGADGAHTVVGTETATGVLNATTFTVPVGTVYKNDGFMTLWTGIGTVDGDWNDNGTSGSGTTGGAALAISGSRTGSGTVGKGGDGRSTTGAGTAGGALGTSYTWPEFNPAGGAGGSVTGGAGGIGTAALAAGSVANHFSHSMGFARGAQLWLQSYQTSRPTRAGSGGGGGGCATNTGTASSGGGGSGGGRVQGFGRVLKGTGTIRAIGGNGGNAAATGDGAAGGGGSGAGGIIEIYVAYAGNWAGTMSVAGGTVGTGINQTVAPVQGDAGFLKFAPRFS
jgi:hypothetical protein